MSIVATYVTMGDGMSVYMYTYVYSVKQLLVCAQTGLNMCTDVYIVYVRTYMFFMCTCIQLRERDREIELCERRGRESRASQRDTDPLGAAGSSSSSSAEPTPPTGKREELSSSAAADLEWWPGNIR